jgi:hypothetical protein
VRCNRSASEHSSATGTGPILFRMPVAGVTRRRNSRPHFCRLCRLLMIDYHRWEWRGKWEIHERKPQCNSLLPELLRDSHYAKRAPGVFLFYSATLFKISPHFSLTQSGCVSEWVSLNRVDSEYVINPQSRPSGCLWCVPMHNSVLAMRGWCFDWKGQSFVRAFCGILHQAW